MTNKQQQISSLDSCQGKHSHLQVEMAKGHDEPRNNWARSSRFAIARYAVDVVICEKRQFGDWSRRSPYQLI